MANLSSLRQATSQLASFEEHGEVPVEKPAPAPVSSKPEPAAQPAQEQGSSITSSFKKGVAWLHHRLNDSTADNDRKGTPAGLGQGECRHTLLRLLLPVQGV